MLSAKYLHQNEVEGNIHRLNSDLQLDVMGVHYFTLEPKQSSMEWCHECSPPRKIQDRCQQDPSKWVVGFRRNDSH